MIGSSPSLPAPDSRIPLMQSNWFASHVDLLLYIYGGLAIALVVWTLWRARKRKRAATQDDSPPSRSD